MGLRPARIYREFKRPYTRTAPTNPRKSYIKGVPGSKLHLYEVGNPTVKYDFSLHIAPKTDVQIRHNALEAGRVAAGNYMKRFTEEKNFFLKVRVVPHHVMREHAQAAIAQADRFYEGMSHPFGKPIGVAARVRKGQPIISLLVQKEHLDAAKDAMRRAASKMPAKCQIVIE